MATDNKHVTWIDCLKGIGILSVVFAHVTEIKSVFVFSIPLFFINAGYLFHPQPFRQYFLKLSQRIAIPYCLFLLFISLFCFRSSIFEHVGDILFGGMRLGGDLGIFWFPPVLFLSLLIYNAIGTHRRPAWVMAIALPLALGVQYINPSLPLNIQSIPLALFYIGAGELISSYIPKQEFVTKTLAKIKTWQTIGIIVALCVLLLVPNIYLDIKYNNYGIPVLSIVLSLLAVALVAVLAVKVSRVGVLELFLSFCGRGSLFIMFVHQFIHFRIFGNCNVWLGFVGTVALSVGLYYIAMRFDITRRVLCGEVGKD